jgi:hypothetical protein
MATTAKKKKTEQASNPVGRPRSLTPEDVAKLVIEFDNYIKTSSIPVIAEFAYKNGLTRQSLYDYDEFSTLLKICTEKKEAQLELMSLRGEVNSTQAIFSLKQMGWKDRESKIVFVDPKTLTDKELKELIDNGGQ